MTSGKASNYMLWLCLAAIMSMLGMNKQLNIIQTLAVLTIQHGKDYIMVRNYCQYHSKMTNSWIPPLVNSNDGVDFAMLFTLRESRRTSDSALLRV